MENRYNIVMFYPMGWKYIPYIKHKRNLKDNTIISYSDIQYKQHILQELLTDSNDITIVVDADYEKGPNKYYVTGKTPYSKLLYSKTVELKEFEEQYSDNEIHGEFIGLWKISPKGAGLLQKGT